MHNQVLVIAPKDMDLNDIMYWYQEIDKNQNGRMCDERCHFKLELPEKEIKPFLTKIEHHIIHEIKEHGKRITYRATHSFDEYTEKFGREFEEYNFPIYTSSIDDLAKYYEVKDLEYDNPEQIKLIKDYGWLVDDKVTDLYVKGLGYGYFDNPYHLWDFWNIVNEHRFPRHINFLIGVDNHKDNIMPVYNLDVERTLNNIYGLTRVWEYIILVDDDPKYSKLYSTNDICFEGRDDVLVDNLDVILKDIVRNQKYSEHYITAIDFHW